MNRIENRMRMMLATGILLAMSGATAHAVTVDRTWDGSTDLLWSTDTNWSGDSAPDTIGTNGEFAVIGDTAVARNISADEPSHLGIKTWTQSSNAVNKITLAMDVTEANLNTNGFSNTSGNAANMVLDLNGFTYSRGGNTHKQNLNAGAATQGFTILSTTPGGIYRQAILAFMSDSMVIGAGVTIKTFSGFLNQLAGTWDDSSTYWSAGNYTGTGGTKTNLTAFSADGTGSIANLIIGDAASANINYTEMLASQSGAGGRIRGNVTINTYVGATGGAASRLVFTGNADTTAVPYNLIVGGNWTDAATDATGYEGAAKFLDDDGVGPNPSQWFRRTITFNGSPVTERTISIQRTALVNDFAVGVDATDKGNILLVNDLSTAGRFLVRADSHLNVDDQTLAATTFISDEGAIYSYIAGATDAGVINVAGANADGTVGVLTLAGFDLNVDLNQDWVDGTDLILFTYASLNGTPTLLTNPNSYSFSFDELAYDGGTVRLTNVVALIPEPATMGLMAIGLVLMLGRSRRR
ncbi:MAG: PEP-CTERM sorting domain-containing protein [Phycisphaeraceae bacterium]